jgi:low affinity Fe/Cu permease
MITRIANFVGEIEGLWILLTIVLGVGALGYVEYAWFVYLLNHGRFITLTVFGIFTFISVVAAFARIPIALIVVLGCATVCGVALLSGYSDVLLP